MYFFLCEQDGRTSLHYACEKGYVEVVKLLLADSRVDVKRQTNVRRKTIIYHDCDMRSMAYSS